MRLSTIKLSGFKSFVDPTTLHLPTNMTGVVGPNGCGKSNIIDAVRWVMGESSASRLRGDSLTDVIFAGSSARKPVSQAMVELIFDNSDHTITGEYAAFNEISVKRTVSRDSTNQYYLNGAKCRRRDITDLFLGTGLGPRSYSIIEQGMIAGHRGQARGTARLPGRSRRHLQVQGAPQGNRNAHPPHAREPGPPERPARGSRQAARTPQAPGATGRAVPGDPGRTQDQGRRVEGAGTPRPRRETAGPARQARPAGNAPAATHRRTARSRARDRDRPREARGIGRGAQQGAGRQL